MSTIVESLKDVPIVCYRKGTEILTQGEKTEKLFFLFDGSVEVVKDKIQVSVHDGQGTLFGELAFLLDVSHTATVCCLEDSSFYTIENAASFINKNPEAIWYISQILAARLFNLTDYVVNLKSQASNPECLGLVKDILSELQNQDKAIVHGHVNEQQPNSNLV